MQILIDQVKALERKMDGVEDENIREKLNSMRNNAKVNLKFSLEICKFCIFCAKINKTLTLKNEIMVYLCYDFFGRTQHATIQHGTTGSLILSRATLSEMYCKKIPQSLENKNSIVSDSIGHYSFTFGMS